MFFDNSQKYRICSMKIRGSFKKVFSEAIRTRLSPHTTLHSDQLAYAIGYEGATIRNWLRGEHEPSGAAVAACIHFFASQNDHAFMQELYGEAVTPLVTRNREAEEALTFVRGLAKFAQGGAAA